MGYLGPKLGVSRATLFKRIKLILRKKEVRVGGEIRRKGRDVVGGS